MKELTINVPKFCNAVYRKMSVYLSCEGVEQERFLAFCFAVLLAVRNQLSKVIPSLTLSDKEDKLLDVLYNLGLYVKSDREQNIILRGLSPTVTNDTVILDLELMIHYFFNYHFLSRQKNKTKIDEAVFDSVCERFEDLRSRYGVPGRFVYNKFKRRDGHGSFNGIVMKVLIPAQPDTYGTTSREMAPNQIDPPAKDDVPIDKN